MRMFWIPVLPLYLRNYASGSIVSINYSLLDDNNLTKKDISKVGEFDETDTFMGFHEDTLSSVVLSHASTINSTSIADVLEKCKQDLISYQLFIVIISF